MTTTEILGCTIRRDVNNWWWEAIIDVDRFPSREDLRYEAIDRGEGKAYIGFNADGFGQYFFHNPRNQTGFGGATFHVHLLDGTTVDVKGPWSGSPSSVYEVNGMFVHDVVLNSRDDGYGGLIQAMTDAALRKLLEGSLWTTRQVTDPDDVLYPAPMIVPVAGFYPQEVARATYTIF